MEQTAGKAFARRYFYENYLPPLMTDRALRSSNFLTLLGEDFREIEHLKHIGVPSYRIFSVESDHAIYEKQRLKNRQEDYGVALHYGELIEYLHSYLFTDHRISVFNLDICGSFLKRLDPALGKLLDFARRNPSTVMATYSSAGRDKEQLMEGLKSLVILLWQSPEAIDRLVRHLFSQYRSVEIARNDGRRSEASKNMLLRHLFWLRSHMEHIMVGSYNLGLTSKESVTTVTAGQEVAWKQFVATCQMPLTYDDVFSVVMALEPPPPASVWMDMNFGDIELLTYAANNGFYHNCYFATYEHDGSTVTLDTWLVESAMNLRRNDIVLIGLDGERYPSTHGRIAVNTDEAFMWGSDSLTVDLRRIAIPPSSQKEEESEAAVETTDEELLPDTIEQIHALARKGMNARQISKTLSLKMPMGKVIAQVAVARRKK